MVKTVIEAFNKFMKDYVNLDPDETILARCSRDWLFKQIKLFPIRNANFPRLFSEKDIYFGSFARRTKKRKLDDIDNMIALSAESATYYEYPDGTIYICVNDSSLKLKKLCYDNSNILNSRKVINKFIASLEDVPQYEKADINRNLEAATLKLKTYSWNFDIVPCFFTNKEINGRDYYLIPNGYGNWKKTDPRIDQAKVSEINQFHDGNILNLIRLMKYWNERQTMPSMSSYLLENMILNYYSSRIYEKAYKYVDLEIPYLLNYLKTNIFSVVNDPKGIQGNINTLTLEDQLKIYNKANSDYNKALEARKLENDGQYNLSISKWREVFGNNFPTYS